MRRAFPALAIETHAGRRPLFETHAVEAQLDVLMDVIGTVRALRSEYNVPPAAAVRVELSNASPELLA